MWSLILDTTTKLLVIGLAKDGQLKDSIQVESFQSQNEKLITEIDRILNRNEKSKEDISTIIISNGPGSYTGLRVSITFVKVFCIVRPDVKVYTINSLLSYCPENNGTVVLDARSNRFYVGDVISNSVSNIRIENIDTLKNMDNLQGETLKILGHDNIGDISENILKHKMAWKKVENINALTPLYLQ